jgi:hypothetical protein
VRSLFSTHTFYKVFWLSQVLASYFEGHSVTHYFGHPSDPLTTCVHVPKNDIFFMRKVTDFLFSKTLLRKVVSGCTIHKVR